MAVIGTGSSAVQAIPIIAQEAEQLTVFQRTANFSVPAWNAPLTPTPCASARRATRCYRRAARTTTAGNPWNARRQSVWDATPEEREREFEERYAIGGFCLHAAYSDLFSDPAANELVCEFLRDKIRERVHDPGSPSCSAPTTIRSAPSGCASTPTTSRPTTAPTCGSSRSASDRSTRSRRAACASATSSSRSTRSCSAPASTRSRARCSAIDLRGRGGLPLREKWAEGPRTALGLTLAGFPNLFTVTGPGSPSVLSNMMVSIEQHVDWIVGLHRVPARARDRDDRADRRGRGRLGRARTAVGDASLYPRANSWYMGANIPGKPRVLLPYVGGVGAYRELCDAVAERGYEGFLLSPAH